MLSSLFVVLLTGCGGAGAGEDSYTSAIDQDNSSVAIVGAIGTPVVQSFVPGQPTSTGADIRASGTGSLTGDYRISLYASYDPINGVSGMLATGEVYDVPRGTDARVRWNPVDVIVGDTYYLYIELIGGALLVGFAGSGNDQYPDGDALEGSGNLANVSDIYFTTYYAQY